MFWETSKFLLFFLQIKFQSLTATILSKQRTNLNDAAQIKLEVSA